MLFGGGEDDEEENGHARGRGGAAISAAPVAVRAAASAQSFFTAQSQMGSGAPDADQQGQTRFAAGRHFHEGAGYDADSGDCRFARSPKVEALAALEQRNVGDASAANILERCERRCRRAGQANWRLLKPASADAPTPPARPIEFASRRPVGGEC